MKVLTLIQCANLGGMEHNALMLIDEFRAMGIQNELISLNPVGEMGALLKNRGVPAQGISYSGRWGWRSMGALRRLLKSTRADGMVMVGHNTMAMLALGNTLRAHRTLSIHYHHKTVKPDWQWRLIYRIATMQFRHITFVSQYIMTEALQIAPVLRRCSLMVSTPILAAEKFTEDERKAARRRLQLPELAQIVGNAGWLVPRKRWDVFLKVAALVARAAPEAIFLIAGDGPERASLEGQAQALGIGGKVRWVGWQKELNDFYRSLDVLLFNSDWDAQPRTPLEAMSRGIPVVASVVRGGTREVITEDSAGVLLSKHDHDALASHVVRFLQEPQMAREVGERGRQRIRTYGSPRRHAERVLQAMNLPVAGELLARSPGVAKRDEYLESNIKGS